MRILLAPDSFKECLSAAEVCRALADGIAAVAPAAETLACPVADGGEGTAEVLASSLGGQFQTLATRQHLGEPLTAQWLWVPGRRLAVVECAAACGLALVPPERRDVRRASTRGVGELLAAALAAGPREILLTIGGSGTVDGGSGLARALGYRFLDAAGQDLPEGGGALARLARIVPPPARPWADVQIEVACDVDNPLLGPRGAVAVFAPQKGATPEQLPPLEAGLARLAECCWRDLGVAVAELPGAGAAGGLGAGAVAFLGARLRPGIELVLDCLGFAERLRDCDLVLTGEGRTDAQTAGGKVCAGVARAAAAARVPCVILSGALTGSAAELRALGATAAFSLAPGPRTLAEALAHAREDLGRTAGNVVALFAAGRDSTAPI